MIADNGCRRPTSVYSEIGIKPNTQYLSVILNRKIPDFLGEKLVQTDKSGHILFASCRKCLYALYLQAFVKDVQTYKGGRF
jgi:hypothetical protein